MISLQDSGTPTRNTIATKGFHHGCLLCARLIRSRRFSDWWNDVDWDDLAHPACAGPCPPECRQVGTARAIVWRFYRPPGHAAETPERPRLTHQRHHAGRF